MCLILLAAEAHPRYPLIVAANRDESYGRSSAAAAFWIDEPSICGGRDLDFGGTWLGISRSGRFAALTNYRQGTPRPTGKRSRGALTRGFLAGQDAPEAYLATVERDASHYNGFSLIVGAPDSLWFYSNRGARPCPIEPGVHGLSNHLLDEPWPKVRRGVAELGNLLHAAEDELLQRLFDMLADRRAADDHLLPSTGLAPERERAMSASFIPGDTYGTRASTVVLVGADGRVVFKERAFGPHGRPAGESEQRFELSRPVSGRIESAARA